MLPGFVHPRRPPLGWATYLRQDESLLIFVTSLLASPSVLCGGCSERTFTAFRFITNAHAMFNRKYSEYKGIIYWISFATFCGGPCPCSYPYPFSLSRFVHPSHRPLGRATYPQHDASLLNVLRMMDHAFWFEWCMRTALAIFTGTHV